MRSISFLIKKLRSNTDEIVPITRRENLLASGQMGSNISNYHRGSRAGISEMVHERGTIHVQIDGYTIQYQQDRCRDG